MKNSKLKTCLSSAYSRARFDELRLNRPGAAIAPHRVMAQALLRERVAALHQRAFELSCAVVTAYPKGPYLDEPSRVVWRQLIRAVTSTTLNFEEAEAGSSDADFIAKMQIALREVKEARVAIRLILACKLAGHQALPAHEDEARQLALIFAKNHRQQEGQHGTAQIVTARF